MLIFLNTIDCLDINSISTSDDTPFKHANDFSSSTMKFFMQFEAETFTNIMSKYDIDSPEQLEAIIMQGTKGAVVDTALSKEAVTDEVLLQYGIDSQEALDMAFSNSEFV